MPLPPRAPTQQKTSATPVPIKRVLRRDGHSICGVCRKTYAREADASTCLESCLAHWLRTAPPVNEVKDGAAQQFRCGFCKRVYMQRADAQRCADGCRTQTKKNVDSERSVNPARAAAAGTAPSAAGKKPSAGRSAAASSAGLGKGPGQTARAHAPHNVREADEDDVAEPRSAKSKAPKFGREHMHKFLRDGRKLVCRKCGKESASMDAVVACFDAHVAPPKTIKVEKKAPAPKAPRPAPAVVTPPTISPVAAEAPKAKTEDDSHKFYRDGARYVCRTCSEKYFTRSEVAACFDKH